MVSDMPKLGNSGCVGWFGKTSMHFQPGALDYMVGDMPKLGNSVRIG